MADTQRDARIDDGCWRKTATSHMTRTADEAVTAASVIGFPVALKAVGPMILHKTERQAVRLVEQRGGRSRCGAGL